MRLAWSLSSGGESESSSRRAGSRGARSSSGTWSPSRGT